MQKQNKKVIVVVGATGKQGGAVVNALLENYANNVIIKGITRNLNSEQAQGLTNRGVIMVQADSNDIKSLVKAFQGANCAFLVTNYFESLDPKKELQQAKNLADAAKEAKLEHVVWSTLECTKKTKLAGNVPEIDGYLVPHFDAKGEAEQYFKDIQLPTTHYRTSWYYENLFLPGVLSKIEEGKIAFTINMGDKKFPTIGLKEIGKGAANILVNKLFVNETIGVASEIATIKQMAEILSKVVNAEVFYNELTDDQYRSLGFPMAKEFGNMYAFMRICNEEYIALREKQKNVIPNPQNFQSWAEQNKEQLKKLC